jgi:hypothetical protein
VRCINEFFESYVEISRMQVGKRQTVETLINEEALIFAKYLRDELKEWMPRFQLAYASLINLRIG